MTKAIKTLSIIGAVFLSGAIASGTALAIKKHQNVNDEQEAIQLSLLDSVVSSDSDLGKMNPGDSKTQSFSVTSLIDMKTTIFVGFVSNEKNDAYDYVNVRIAVGEGSKEGKLTEFISGVKDYHFHMNPKETKKLDITYSIKDDVPENILGTSLNFSVTFDAHSAL